MNSRSTIPMKQFYLALAPIRWVTIISLIIILDFAPLFANEGGGYGGAVSLVLKSNYLDKAEQWKISPYPNLSPSILLYNQNIFRSKILPEVLKKLPQINGEHRSKNGQDVITIQEDTIIILASKVKQILLKTGAVIDKFDNNEIPTELYSSLALIVSDRKILFLPKTNIYIDRVILEDDQMIDFYPFKGEDLEEEEGSQVMEPGLAEENESEALAIPVAPNWTIPTVLNNTQSLKMIRGQVDKVNRNLAQFKQVTKLNITVDDAIVIPLPLFENIILTNGKQIGPNDLRDIDPRIRYNLALKLEAHNLTVYPRLNLLIKKINLKMGQSINFNPGGK